jgi:phosphoribosylformimino-5-aminoimidazole carboxamide ribotide isomerase
VAAAFACFRVTTSGKPCSPKTRWRWPSPRLHIVDLDGAAVGEPMNLDVIRVIAGAVLVPTQLGGGVRQLETVEELLRAGIDRVILSTAAVENPELVKMACQRFGESVVVSVDAREGQVATHGWRQATELAVGIFIRTMRKLGVRRFVYTDIARDGTLTEPNFAAISEVIDAFKVPIIASGGIASLNHLRMLKKLGAEAAIVGRALYTGDIDLKQALAEIS